MGLLVGAVGVGTVTVAAFVMGSSRAVGFVDGVLTCLALGVATKLKRDWRRALISSIAVGTIAGLFGAVMFGLAKDAITLEMSRFWIICALVVLISGLGATTAGSRRNWRVNLGTGVAAGTLLTGGMGAMVFGLVVMLPADVSKTLQIAGFASTVLFALFFTLTERLAGIWAGVVAGALPCAGGWIASLIMIYDQPLWPALPLGVLGILLGLTFAWWWPILYPFLAAWNTLLLRIDQRRPAGHRGLLRWNSAFWYEHQRLPLVGLNHHLVLTAERNPAEGQAALRYLATTPQRWAAQAAHIELEARRLERCADVGEIGHVHDHLAAGELPGPASALLTRFGQVSQDVSAALNQATVYHQRLLLRNAVDRLSSLLDELTRSSESYAVRFHPVATRWLQIVAAKVDELAEAAETRQEIDNPYVFGVPLTDQHPIFVGRADIAARIEQLLLDQRRPPLLLFGQRRMGKTSLLRNLGRLLPSTIVPLFVDGEGIAGAVDYADLLYCLAREMTRSAEPQGTILAPLSLDALAPSPFTVFGEWLDQVEQDLTQSGREIGLLTLDEFEALDSVFGKGRFDEFDFLRMLRHLIQHRPRFKVLLSGSHLFDEHPRWASFLVNVQVVKIGFLEEDEAIQLVEHPVKDFRLGYEPGACRRVLELTRGHPHLLQLLCYEIVELKNSQPPPERVRVRLGDVEAAVQKALDTGRFFFVDIQHNQVTPPGVSLLQFLANRGENAVVDRALLSRHVPKDLDRTLEGLFRRDLIEESEGGYRFQIELIRRWFAGRV
jgi:hypothetical protein